MLTKFHKKKRKLAFVYIYTNLAKINCSTQLREAIDYMVVTSDVEEILAMQAPHVHVYEQLVREFVACIRSRNTSIQSCKSKKAFQHIVHQLIQKSFQPPSFIDEDAASLTKIKEIISRTNTTGRKCVKCGHRTFTYDRQERSADEGSTVYHMCLSANCGHLQRIA